MRELRVVKATPIIEHFNNRAYGFVNAIINVEYAFKGYSLEIGDIITFKSGYRFFVISKAEKEFVISMLYNIKTKEEFLLERKLNKIICEAYISGKIKK